MAKYISAKSAISAISPLFPCRLADPLRIEDASAPSMTRLREQRPSINPLLMGIQPPLPAECISKVQVAP